MLVHTKYLLDRESGLFYHGWNFETKSNYGGNFWCRGNSWLTLGIPLFMKIMGDRLPKYVYDYLLEIHVNQVTALIDWRGEDHLWHTIITDKTSYTETSGSAGILAGILTGLNEGLVIEGVTSAFIEESLQAILE